MRHCRELAFSSTRRVEGGGERRAQRQRETMAQRLFQSIPRAKHLCFYPMDRKRESSTLGTRFPWKNGNV